MSKFHENVAPVVMLALHRISENNQYPEVLFVRYKNEEKLTIPYVYLRSGEQPYRGGLRILNSSFELGINNVRLRCYYANRILKEEEDDSLAVYYALKLREEEVSLLSHFFENLDETRFQGYQWVSVEGGNLSEEIDESMHYCWEHLRFSVASNYGLKLKRRNKDG